MARFDVYRNPGDHQASVPYLLDVQSNYLDALHTRIVIPLRRIDAFPPVALPKDLIPVFVIEDNACLLDTPQLAAIPSNMLKTSVMSLSLSQSAIMMSLDRLFGGF
jgi:toxin CcdB